MEETAVDQETSEQPRHEPDVPVEPDHHTNDVAFVREENIAEAGSLAPETSELEIRSAIALNKEMENLVNRELKESILKKMYRTAFEEAEAIAATEAKRELREVILKNTYRTAFEEAEAIASAEAQAVAASMFEAVMDRISGPEAYASHLVTYALALASDTICSRISANKHAPAYVCKLLLRSCAKAEDVVRRLEEAAAKAEALELAHSVAKNAVVEWERHARERIAVAGRAASIAIFGVAPVAIQRAIDICEGSVCVCGNEFLDDSVFCRMCGEKRQPRSQTGDIHSADAKTSRRTLSYLVDNSVVLANTAGLGYRRSKELEDHAGTWAEWFSTVQGFDEGDEWIRVGDWFLPKKVNGNVVITRLEELDPSTDGAVPGLREEDRQERHLQKLTSQESLAIRQMASESLGRAYRQGLTQAQIRAEESSHGESLQEQVEALVAASVSEGVSKSREVTPIPALEDENATATSAAPSARPFASPHRPATTSHATASLAASGWPIGSNATRAVSTAPAPPSTWREHPRTSESSTRMPRQDSLKMLAVLYGPAADQKLAQKTPSTAGSSWSARSRSITAGQPSAATSSAIPSPPSTAKPKRKPPASRLAQRAQSRPDHRSQEEKEKAQKGEHLVHHEHDPEKLRELDQRRLRRQFLKNLQTAKDRQGEAKRSEAALREYYWRMREMEVESKCRKVERKWHEREAHRRECVEQKRQEFAGQCEEALNLRYGRIFASLYSPKQPSHASMDRPRPTSRPPSEMEIDSLWEAEALAVFQHAYHEAVGRYIAPTPPPGEERSLADEGGIAGWASSERSMTPSQAGRSQATPVTNAKLRSLPVGRVEWESPRNPWCTRRNGPPPPVEAIVASLLGDELSSDILSPGPSRHVAKVSSGRPPGPTQHLAKWRQLPPVVPQPAVQ